MQSTWIKVFSSAGFLPHRVPSASQYMGYSSEAAGILGWWVFEENLQWILSIVRLATSLVTRNAKGSPVIRKAETADSCLRAVTG